MQRAIATSPIVSVIIPTCDRTHLLDAALESVAAQVVEGGVEVIVVDVGRHSAATVVASWRDALAITRIETDGDRRPAAARNAAIQIARGQFIAFLDDDDLFLPGHLAAGLQPLLRKEADFVYLSAIVTDQRLAAIPANPNQFLRKAYPYNYRFLLVANFIHTGSVIVRNFRDTVVRFDNELDVCEDWDLWLALTTTLQYRVVFINKVTSVYHQIAAAPGLVAGAQLVAPSQFAIARDHIQKKWPSSDPLICGLREWMSEFERFRSDLIAKQQRMPNLLFDSILAYLYARILCGQPPLNGQFGAFFESASNVSYATEPQTN